MYPQQTKSLTQLVNELSKYYLLEFSNWPLTRKVKYTIVSKNGKGPSFEIPLNLFGRVELKDVILLTTEAYRMGLNVNRT